MNEFVGFISLIGEEEKVNQSLDAIKKHLAQAKKEAESLGVQLRFGEMKNKE